MSQMITVFDSSSERLVRSSRSIDSVLSFVDNHYDVSVSGTVDFTLVSGTLTSSNSVDVLRNGVLTREGESNDYTRNTGLNKIVFNQAPEVNSWIMIRVFS